MPPITSTTVKIDHIDTTRIKEKFGVIVYMERVAYIIGLANTNKDYRTLKEALDDAGLPTWGSLPEGTGFDNLMLYERNVVMLDTDKAEVTLIYDMAEGEGQSYDDPPFGAFIGEVKANVSQVTRNTDADGYPLSVEYSYPSDYILNPDLAGVTDVQGGEITVFQPQRTRTYNGIKNTDEPWTIESAIVGLVNDDSIWNGDARTWLCTGCSWRLCDAIDATNRYFMSFEFQYNPDLWDSSIVYIDPNTGKPPADLVDGTGYKTIEILGGGNFENIIGCVLQ